MKLISKILGIVIAVIIIGAAIGFMSIDSNNNKSSDSDSQEISKLTGEVNIGLILPLTGDLSSHGMENWEGSKFGVTEFNKHLEEINAPWHLKMISEDSATNPVVALEKLTSLNAKGIKMIVGPETSSNIRNMKGYSDSNNMLLVSCCSTAPALSIPNDSVYRLVANDSNQGIALGKLIQHENIKVLVPVWRGDTWGDGLSEATANSFTERGGIVDDGIRYNPESPEFSATTSLLADIVQGYVDEYGEDHVSVLLIGFGESLQVIQSASEHDILDDIIWFGSDSVTKDHKLVDDPIGLDFLNKVKFTSIQSAVSKNPINERVEAHLIETMGRVPNSYVHSSYDAVWILGLAMLETQSTDVSVIKSVISDVAENYSGAIGPIILNEAGDLAYTNYEIWGIRGDDWVSRGQYTQSTDTISFHDSGSLLPLEEPTSKTDNQEIAQKLTDHIISVYDTTKVLPNGDELVFHSTDNTYSRYVFILNNETEKIIAHPNPDVIGKTIPQLNDTIEPYDEVMKTLRDKGITWYHYDFENPDTNTVDPKMSWLKLDNGLIYGSGFYNYNN